MAQWTGGRVFAPTVGAALDQAFTDIITELRTQYMLALLSEERAADQGAFPPAGSPGAASGFAGDGAQRLLW